MQTESNFFPFYSVTHVNDVFVGEGLVGLVVLRVFEEDFVHVGRRVLVQLVGRAEDDEGDFTVTQDAEFVGLLHHAELALVERDLSVPLVSDAGDLNLFPTHLPAASVPIRPACHKSQRLLPQA